MLLTVSQRLIEPRAAELHLELPFDLRSRSRFRARCRNGDEVGVTLSRGQVLRGGDLLLAANGQVILVHAACETVSTVRCFDPRPLARAAYHLGNRHVALQIGAGWLRYGHDHVLDAMVQGLGLSVAVEQAPFEPESGAYHAAGENSHHHHEH